MMIALAQLRVVQPRYTMPSRKSIAPCLLAALLFITMQPGWSAQCSVSTPGVNFGNYDTFSIQNLDGAGTISVVCDTATSYTILLSSGAGTYASRTMASGAHHLTYNLYVDAARTSVWGDGSAGTSIISGSGTTANHTVYGRIPARQNAYVGSYSDSIIITLNF